MPTIRIRVTNSQGFADWTLDFTITEPGERISLATVDSAGGSINNSRGIASTINGSPVAVEGDSVDRASAVPAGPGPLHVRDDGPARDDDQRFRERATS